MVRFALCTVALAICGVIAQPTITPLSTDAESSLVWCYISDDGMSVFGRLRFDGVFAGHRWDRATDWQSAFFPDAGEWLLYGINHDASVVALTSRNPRNAYRWSQETGVVPLDQGEGKLLTSVSRDGRVILGAQSFVPCRWVDGVYEQIGPPGTQGVSRVCSADGSIVFGHDYSQDFRAFLWESDTDSCTLPAGPTPDYDAYLYDVNASGTLGVGSALEDPRVSSDSGDGWNDLILPTKYENGEFVTLPTTESFYQYFSTSMDETAQLIGGHANRAGTIDEQVALIWINSGVPMPLSDYLLSQGLSTDGWAFQYISDITPDGRHLVGSGVYDGQLSAFIIDLSPATSCDADMNGDGNLDFFDISTFLSAFVANDPAADFTDDGLFSLLDISAFLIAFNAGCP